MQYQHSSLSQFRLWVKEQGWTALVSTSCLCHEALGTPPFIEAVGRGCDIFEGMKLLVAENIKISYSTCFLCVCIYMHGRLFIWEEATEGWMNPEIQ